MQTDLTHLSLCSGVGGLDLAAEWAGFKTIGQCEINPYASKVLAKNFIGVKNYGDIRTITVELLAADGIRRGEITVISAGIPCQPYSFAGKGLGDGDERDLEQELVRVVGELRPKWVVVENTPGLFARKNQRYFHRILSDLSALGYSLAWGIWGACDVGAWHKRERVFIVAYSPSERRNQIEIFVKKPCKSGETQSRERIQKSGFEFNGVHSFLRWCKTVGNHDGSLDGLSEEMDRLESLGNAVVPQQAYPIFRAIADYENQFI